MLYYYICGGAVKLSISVVEEMIEIIESNLPDALSLEEISQYVGYSPYYCSVKFHEITGITMKSYIANRKLFFAVKELTESRLRITDIALRYGFSSQSAFTHAFVNTFGCTPKQCRKGQNKVKICKPFDRIIIKNKEKGWRITNA
jgi:AraC family multidrug resistance transcriptional activator